MHRHRTPPVLLLAVALTAACQDAAREPLAPELGSAPSLAKGPPTNADPRAAFFWEEDPGNGVQGDARLGDGSAGSNEFTAYPGERFSAYDDGRCGVQARFFVENGGGDATLQPAAGWKSLSRDAKAACMNAQRTVTLVYRDPEVPTFEVRETVVLANANALWWNPPEPPTEPLPATAPRLGDLRLQAGPYCDFLSYGRVDGSANAKITETTYDDAGASRRQWRIESVGPHAAYCEAKGRTFTMPFVLVVREKAPL